jgi:hypothetical protein
MRRFAVDAVRLASVQEEPALEVAAATGQQGYGIFSGPAEHTAVLLFDPEAARWVAEEEWHPQQRASALPDGGLRLEVPYSNPQEIIMDILRHGPHVEVVSPASLRSAVAEQHRQAADKYELPKRSVASARVDDARRDARARHAPARSTPAGRFCLQALSVSQARAHTEQWTFKNEVPAHCQEISAPWESDIALRYSIRWRLPWNRSYSR